MVEAVGLDKKGAGADVTVILLDRIGHAVPYKMPKACLVDLLDSLHKERPARLDSACKAP